MSIEEFIASFSRFNASLKNILDQVPNKVEKVEGKQLSTEDYTTLDKAGLRHLMTSHSLTAEGDTVSINLGLGSLLHLTLTQPETTLAFVPDSIPNDQTRYVTLIIKQGTGANKLLWPSNVLWPNGHAPVLAYVPAAEDVITLIQRGDSQNYYGFMNGSWMSHD